MKRLKNEAPTAFLTFCGSDLTVAVGANTLGYLDLRNVSFTKVSKKIYQTKTRETRVEIIAIESTSLEQFS